MMVVFKLYVTFGVCMQELGFPSRKCVDFQITFDLRYSRGKYGFPYPYVKKMVIFEFHDKFGEYIQELVITLHKCLDL